MFLPWYEKNTVRGSRFIGDAVSAFGTLSFVEAAIFLVSAGVLALLFTRAEGREFELPGGDGTVILVARRVGGAAAVLAGVRPARRRRRGEHRRHPVGLLRRASSRRGGLAAGRMAAASARARRPAARRPPPGDRASRAPPPRRSRRARQQRRRRRRTACSRRVNTIGCDACNRTFHHRGRPRGPAGRRLPRRRVRRARGLPRHPARQARPRRGPGRRRQDRAGQGAVALSRAAARAPAVLRGPRRGQGAVRVELPQAAPAHPGRGPGHRLERGAGRHLRRGVPPHPPAAAGDLLRGARRAADRRDRQDRPGVRGDAARDPERLPGLDPRARARRGAHPAGRAADVATTRAS